VHLECDAQAQSAVEAELVSEHPLTFNTVTQHDSPLSFPRILGNSDCAAVSPRPNDGYAIKSCCGGIQTGIAREQPTRLLVNATPQMLLAWACNILD
jgi:hypothetical protein